MLRLYPVRQNVVLLINSEELSTEYRHAAGIEEEIPHRGCMLCRDGFETRPYHVKQSVVIS